MKKIKINLDNINKGTTLVEQSATLTIKPITMQQATITIAQKINETIKVSTIELETYKPDTLINIATVMYCHTKNVLDITVTLNDQIIYNWTI